MRSISSDLMKTQASIIQQPRVAIVVSAIGAALLLVSWLACMPQVSSVAWYNLAALATALIGAKYLAYLFPVHIRYTLKLEMGSAPLYLAAVLLPVPVAGATVAVASILTSFLARAERGSTASDIATQAGRWTAIALGASVVAHLSAPALSPAYLSLLVVAALILLVGDLLTVPFEMAPINGEPIPHLIVECARGGGIAEACQYLFGMMGAVLALTNVWNVTLLLVPLILVHRMVKRAKELHDSTRILLETLADQVDSKDAFTHEHSKRVMERTREILRELQISGPEAQLIITAARLHDIGKISLPDGVLHKHEALTPEEWKIMEQHPVLGADMVARYPAFARGSSIVRYHHERLDGKGYPDRIAGAAIPFGARVLAVADSYDAMTSDRPYRKGMPVERAASILRGGRGTQWDPDVVDAFLRVIGHQIEPAVSAETAPLTHAARTV